MANKKVLYLHDDGYPIEVAPATDVVDLGELNVTGPIAMNGEVISGLPSPVGGLADQAATKGYVDEQVIAGGHVKEPVFDLSQLVDAEGILAGEAIYFTAQPAVGDHVKIDDGTNSEDYVFVANIAGESAPTDVSRESSAATALARLVTRINAGSAYWKGVYLASSHSDIHSPVAFIMDQTTDASPSTSRIYAPTQGNANLMLVEFATGTTSITIRPYTYKTAAASSATDPGYQRFGLNRTVANLTDGEIHLDLSSDNLYSWNGDASTWFQMSGPGSIPLATSASGGGVVGRVTFDQDKGLVISGSAIGAVALKSNDGLQFHAAADADKGKIEMKLVSSDRLTVGVNGLDVAGVPLLFKINGVACGANVTSANLDELTGGGSTSLHTHTGLGDAQKVLDSFTVGEAGGVIVGDPVYIDSAGKLMKCDASTDGKQFCLGVANEVKAQNVACKMIGYGFCATTLTGLGFLAGDRLFVKAGGGLTKTAPTASGKHVTQVGWAQSATDIWVQPQYFGKRA